MRKADILLAFVGPIIGGGLAVILLWRKANRQFPFFFLYVSASIFIGLFRAAVALGPQSFDGLSEQLHSKYPMRNNYFKLIP